MVVFVTHQTVLVVNFLLRFADGFEALMSSCLGSEKASFSRRVCSMYAHSEFAKLMVCRCAWFHL